MLTTKQRTTVYILNADTQRKHICNSHKPTHKPKIAKELSLSLTEKLFLNPFPPKIFKTADAQARQTKRNKKLTAKAQKYNDLTKTVDRRPAYNRVGGSARD